jgi:hypothetical protein
MDAHIATPAAPSAGSTGFPRSVLVAGVALAALIVVALIAALALPHSPATYPAGSPEAAFQEFYQAWESRDLEGAYAHLSAAVRADLSLAGYRLLDSERSWQRDQDRRVVLTGTETAGDRATLQLRVDEFYGGGLGAQRSSWDRSVTLVREDGGWMIDEPLVGLETAYGY